MLSSGFLNNQYGRKPTLLFGQFIMACGWPVLLWGKEFSMIMIGQSLFGIGIGLCITTSFLLLNEISILKWKGPLCALNVLMINLGFLYSFSYASVVTFEWMIFLSGLPSVLSLITMPYLLESPLFWVKQGRVDYR
jgi:MFS family permease